MICSPNLPEEEINKTKKQFLVSGFSYVFYKFLPGLKKTSFMVHF